ncbi:MAG TPA: ABC transporter ATP-binding protein, partial [Jatrophihabitans sp.]|nr:ABC transporter ATP-binding protein [Jatrophihabitans sp.]
PNLTGGEVIDLLGGLRGGLDRGRRAELIERFRLDPTRRCRSYSKGNRQKVALIAALAGTAELLMLDEPTAGLDPLMENVFASCIQQERAAGRTILLSSHIMSEVEALADRVTIIRDGRTVRSGTLAELRAGGRIRVEAVVRQPLATLTNQFSGVQVSGNRISGTLAAAELDAFLDRVSRLGVQSLTSQPPSLDAVFLSLYDQEPT